MQALEELRHDWQLSEVLDLFTQPFNDLLFKAHQIHRKYHVVNQIQASTLLSIKTGACPEDCKYCPQSAHYTTEVEKEPLLATADILKSAMEAKKSGATRFCMGAAWRNINDRDLDKINNIIGEVKALGLETCMTLGMVSPLQADSMKQAGLDYYNHNIDTSEEYYSKVISTRTFQDRLDTLDAVEKAGIHVCCGGIVGMGESLEDRAKMLVTLATRMHHPKSVPINWLVKVAGTPFADDLPDTDPIEFVRVVAVARILMPQSVIRLSAGREAMDDSTQALCFFAGAGSIFFGEMLLTQENPAMEKDKALLDRLGIQIQSQREEVAA